MFLSFVIMGTWRALDCLDSFLAKCDYFLYPDPSGVSEPYTRPASCRKRWVWELLPVGKLDDVSWEASILGDKRS